VVGEEMTREEIEKVADAYLKRALSGQGINPLTDFVIEQVNAALEEAVGETRLYCSSPGHDPGRDCSLCKEQTRAIRALKIK